MAEMSGARMPGGAPPAGKSRPACGMAFEGPSRLAPRAAARRWPPTRAMSAHSAIRATAHGSGSRAARAGSGVFAPAGVPQRWQKRAPGVSDARHAAQAAPESEAPQDAQNWPDAGAEQAGQVVGVAAVRSEEHTSELQSPCNLVCRLLL